MERRRKNIAAAIDAYENAINNGRRGAAVHREVAICYYADGEFDKARQHIDEAQGRDPDNRFVVDLQILIAVKQRNEDRARTKLKTLKLFDSEPFYMHRLSTVEFAFKNFYEANDAANAVLKTVDRPTIAMLAQLVKSEIALDYLDEAENNLMLLEQRFPSTYHDIKVGLRCKLETAKGNFENALGLSGKIREINSPVHKMLKLRALQGYLDNIDENDPKFQSLSAECGALSRELHDFDWNFLDAELGQEL